MPWAIILGAIGVALAAVAEAGVIPGPIGEVVKILGSALTGGAAVHRAVVKPATKPAPVHDESD